LVPPFGREPWGCSRPESLEAFVLIRCVEMHMFGHVAVLHRDSAAVGGRTKLLERKRCPESQTQARLR